MSTSALSSGLKTAPPPLMSTPKPTLATLKSLPTGPRAANGSGGESSTTMPRSSELDGRLTPVAQNEPDGRLSTGSAAPSLYDAGATDITSISGRSQSSSNNNATPYASAEVGLGSLETEEHLKQALLTKDRMFLLVVSNEVEIFVERILNGEAGTPTSGPGPSTLPSLSPSVTLVAKASSKYQRLLVYKVAEWYGLKAMSGPDSSMVIGVLGSLPSQSRTLHLSELVSRPPSPKHTFKIMQRSAGSVSTGASASSSVVDDDGSNPTAAHRFKSLEEREAAYAEARERIYGNSAEGESLGVGFGELLDIRPQPVRAQDDDDPEFEAVPRRVIPDSQPVFGSLRYPPPNPTASSFSPTVTGDVSSGPSSAFSGPGMIGPSYGPMMPDPYTNQLPNRQYPVSQHGPMQYAMGMQIPFDTQMQQGMYMGAPYPQAPQAPWQQMHNYPIPPSQYSAAPPSHMSPSHLIHPQAWYPQRGIPMMQNQPMPMIPQGMPALTPPFTSPQSNAHSQIHQPMPQRPQPYPHSSASSSISSRSMHDGSRPHSRGSTTSTRSAASSVRLGNMYPVSGPGYRQKGMKGQTVGSMTSIPLNSTRPQRSHSPQSSVASTSSRSSRQAVSISINYPSPSQHQLPQRPDWAANNIPYQPIVPPAAGTPDAHEFPPLHPKRQGGTGAEPMQAEKARYAKQQGTVWNGSGGKSLAHSNGSAGSNGGQSRLIGSQGPDDGLVSSPGAPATSRTPVSAVRRDPDVHLTPAGPSPSDVEEGDPDFPRRAGGRGPGVLFDPSAVVSGSTTSGPSNETRPLSPSPEDIIEAKLAAISVSSGISIGPAPYKTQQPAPSYAKIARRA